MAKKIYLSPSNQTANKYAYGNTTEAVQCCRIADATEKALKRCGFEVKNNQKLSVDARCKESNSWGADLHVPIHTNAYNGDVTGTRIFCYSKASKGYAASHAVFNALAPITPGTSESVSVYSTLKETKLPTAPSVYIEVDFHDVAAVAKWIIENTEAIGEAICKGICDHFGVKYVAPAPPKTYKVVLGEYATEAEATSALNGFKGAVTAARNAVDAVEVIVSMLTVE